MNKRYCLIILFLTYRICGAQNLVSNPGLEEHTSCPNSSNQVSLCVGWSSFGNSPDYFHSCSALFGFAPPNAMWGYQIPHSDSAYASLVTYTVFSNYREIIGNELATSLVIGQKYFISFFVNFAFAPLTARFATNKIGLRFSTVPYSEANVAPINNFAHLHSDSIISDTLLWFKISGSFIADSAYGYLAIGNFFQDGLTDTIHVGTGIPEYAMYYIDDVSIYSETGTTAEYVSPGNIIEVFPNPFSNQLTFTPASYEQTTIILYDIFSRQILQRTFTNSAPINTEQLAKGIYLYEVRNKNGMLKQGKVVKE